MDITAGLAKLRSQINKLEKRIHNLDMSEVDPKELHAAIESLNALKARYKEMEEVHAKKKQEKQEKESKDISMDKTELVKEHEHLVDVLKSPSHADDKQEAVKQEKELNEYKEATPQDEPKPVMHPSFQPPQDDRPSLKFPRRPERKMPKHKVVDVPAPDAAPQEKKSDTNKFAIHDVVEPTRGTPGSKGHVMGYDEANDMVYVAWTDGKLKESHGYGAYSTKDLKKHASLDKQAGPGAGREFKVNKGDLTSGTFTYNLETGAISWKEMPGILAFDLLGYYDGIREADGRLVKISKIDIGWWQNGQANVKYDLATAMKDWQKETPDVFRDSTGDIEVEIDLYTLESMIGGGYMRTTLKPGDTFQACGDGALRTNYEMYETSFCTTITCQEEFDYFEQDIWDSPAPEKDDEGNDVDPGDYADMMQDNWKYMRPRAKSSQDIDINKEAAANNAVINAFVHRTDPNIKSSNLYIRDRGDGWDLINYQTVIAKNMGDKILMDNRRYSVTTTKLQGQIGFQASQAGIPLYDMQTGKPMDHEQKREDAVYDKMVSNPSYERISSIKTAGDVCTKCHKALTDDDLYIGFCNYCADREAYGTEPSEDDIFIQNTGHLGSGSVATCNGEEIARMKNGDVDAFYMAIAQWMADNNYSPDVWQISDHGNAELVTDIPQPKKSSLDTDGEPDANDVVETYINGNISDAREWLEQNPDLFPEAMDMMRQYDPRGAQRFVDLCYPFKKTASMDKSAKVVEEKDGWHVKSEEGKNLGGPYTSKDQAVKRLRQVEYFKHHKASLNIKATSWHVLGNGDLEITLDPQTKQDIDPETLDSDNAMYDLFEPVVANGLSWVAPEDIGALTDAPILSDSPSLDDGSADPKANYWWFPQYETTSPARELVEKGRVIFKKASQEVPQTTDKCESCGKELGPEAFLSKWPVCGACTKKRHKKVTKGSVNQIPLNVFDGGYYAVETSGKPDVPHGYAIFNPQGQQVMVVTTNEQLSPDRLSSIVHDEYGKRELVRATLKVDHTTFKAGTKFVVSGINRTKKEIRVKSDKSHFWFPIDKVAVTVDLEQHIQHMKDRMNTTQTTLEQQQAVTTQATVDKEAAEPMPATPAPQGMRWAWDDDVRKWILVKKQGL